MAHRITAMRAHLRNPGLLRIFIDNEHAFTVKLIDTADLKTGMSLTAEQMERLQRKHELEGAYLRSIRYLGYRMRSCREIEQYLDRKKYSPAVVAETIRRLRESRLIDDQAFAHWWVAHRCRMKPRSTHALRFELLQKGIDESIISAALAAADDDRMALALLETKRKQWRRLGGRQKRQKILAFLHRRGFRYEIAKNAYEAFTQQTGQFNDDDEA